MTWPSRPELHWLLVRLQRESTLTRAALTQITGTDCKVFIQLHGAAGSGARISSGEIELHSHATTCHALDPKAQVSAWPSLLAVGAHDAAGLASLCVALVVTPCLCSIFTISLSTAPRTGCVYTRVCCTAMTLPGFSIFLEHLCTFIYFPFLFCAVTLRRPPSKKTGSEWLANMSMNCERSQATTLLTTPRARPKRLTRVCSAHRRQRQVAAGVGHCQLDYSPANGWLWEAVVLVMVVVVVVLAAAAAAAAAAKLNSFCSSSQLTSGFHLRAGRFPCLRAPRLPLSLRTPPRASLTFSQWIKVFVACFSSQQFGVASDRKQSLTTHFSHGRNRFPHIRACVRFDWGGQLWNRAEQRRSISKLQVRSIWHAQRLAWRVALRRGRSSTLLRRDLFEQNQVDSFDVVFEGIRW
jgi:hypothetical protein